MTTAERAPLRPGRVLSSKGELNLMVLAERGRRRMHASEEPAWWAAWVERADRYVNSVQRPGAGEDEIRSELLFCLLGGHGITYELAESAWERLVELGCLSYDWDLAELTELLERELARPQFRPVKRDGSLRRYRYPRSRAHLVVEALHWLKRVGPLQAALKDIHTEHERRKLLCQCPGIGPKTASWILRNSGYASELAVLDIHILRAMDRAGRRPPGRLPQAYQIIEDAFLVWCRELAVPAAALDLFLWEWERETPHQEFSRSHQA
jgi:N-glycosylase/DNA lyase